MSLENVKQYFESVYLGQRVVELEKSSATVEEAAEAIGKMIPRERVESCIGHTPGGVCPFAVNSDVTVYLDVSLKRFERVYPAGGNGHSAVNLSLDELEEYSNYDKWVDVCRSWHTNE